MILFSIESGARERVKNEEKLGIPGWTRLLSRPGPRPPPLFKKRWLDSRVHPPIVDGKLKTINPPLSFSQSNSFYPTPPPSYLCSAAASSPQITPRFFSSRACPVFSPLFLVPLPVSLFDSWILRANKNPIGSERQCGGRIRSGRKGWGGGV